MMSIKWPILPLAHITPLPPMLSCQTPTEDEAYLEDDDDYVRAPIPQKMEQLVDDMVIVNPKRIPSIASTKVR